MKLYHVSKLPNLTMLEPRVSTHKKPYVYATPNLNFALLFGGKSHGDLDGIYGHKDKEYNVPYFYEAYQDSFKNRFKNQSCYVYQVDPTNFLEGQTSFKGELVSEKPAKILSCFKINDLYDYFAKLIEKKQFVLKTYDANNLDYVAELKAHIKDRIVRFEICNDKNSKNYVFCQQHFPDIIKECENELNK